MAGAGLLIVGAILLVATFALSWYTISASLNGSSFAIDFHPNQVVASGGGISVTASYAGSPLNLNNTGNLYTAVEGLIVGGLIVGLLGGILGLLTPSRPNLRKGAVVLGVLALIFAIAGPLMLAAAQPGALASDAQPGSGGGGGIVPTNSSIGPGATFSGSASANGGSISWGPAIGFYLAIVAGVISLIGSLMLLMAKPEPEMAAGPTCPQCGAAFATDEELNAHLAAAHPSSEMPPTPPAA
jgi:hypothetical protein